MSFFEETKCANKVLLKPNVQLPKKLRFIICVVTYVSYLTNVCMSYDHTRSSGGHTFA